MQRPSCYLQDFLRHHDVFWVFLSKKYGGLFEHFAYLEKHMSRQAYYIFLAYNGGKTHSLKRLLDVLGLKDVR